MKQRILLALKGAAMGIAETIPGVSAGTIAFITGIHEKLLESIKAFHPSLIRIYKEKGFRAVFDKVNGDFLINLIMGMVVGVGIGLVGVAYLLENYPPIIWAFFFGLVIAAIFYVASQVKKWKINTVVSFFGGAAIAFGITLLPVAEANESLWFVFICGLLAISGLLLPGISGSFILIILGMYQFILHDTLKDEFLGNLDPHALLILIVYALGMIFGMVISSRFLSWALKQHNGATLAILSGFMLGALSKLWPWRVPTTIITEDGQVVEFVKGMPVDVVIKEENVLPADYFVQTGEPAFVALAIISLIVGFGLVLALDYSSKEKL